jgi:mannosyl-oligosaccharide alpha-1,2-mannosidase
MDEYTKAAAWVRAEMPLDTSFDASVFETIIRVVGGMLAAHDMTGDQWMVDRCVTSKSADAIGGRWLCTAQQL